MSSIVPTVCAAIEDLRASFSNSLVEVEADNSGGAYVIVRNIPLGSPYVQTNIWVGFQITFQYPYADVYPHFTQPDLAREDGSSLGEGFGHGQFRNLPAIQISRRANKLNPAVDTAALKLLKVLKWLRDH